MVFRRPDPTFLLVTAVIACLVAGLTVILVDLALKGGLFEPIYPKLNRAEACRPFQALDRFPMPGAGSHCRP